MVEVNSSLWNNAVTFSKGSLAFINCLSPQRILPQRMTIICVEFHLTASRYLCIFSENASPNVFVQSATVPTLISKKYGDEYRV